MNKPSFFAELKRRNVYKVAVAYAVVGWLVMQVTATVVPALHLPGAITTGVVVLVLLGFPIALVLAWAFEMTPQGMKRTDEVGPNEKLPQWSRRKFVALILVIALMAAALLGYQLFRANPAPRQSEAATAISDKSIAVLPLVNQSGDPAQEYFSDGLTEELINGLGQIPELRVIGRNSSFHLKGKGGDSRVIGQALGVAHLLEGSVRKAGDRVRIGVQLVNAADGSQRWSDTYDRELKDIFAVQEEIAKAVAHQLRVRLLGEAAAVTSQPSNQNLAAYSAFLQATSYFEKANPASVTEALAPLDEAIRLDAKYAEAYALKARALNFLAVRGGALSRQQFEEARAAARAALALKPDLASARAAMAYIYIFCDWNFAAAEAELNAIRQKDASALNNLGSLRAIQGRLDETIALRQEAVRLDPLHAEFHRIIGNSLVRAGRLDEAEAALRKALELQPEARQAHGPLASLATLRGDLDRALKEAELQRDPGGIGIAIVRFARGEREQADAALQALIKTHADRALSIAAVYAFRGEADQMFDWLNQAYEQREPTLVSALGVHPFFMRYYSDPRFVELCRKTGVTLSK